MYDPLSYHTHAQLQVESIKDQVREALHTLAGGTTDSLTEEQLKDFKKRKLISNVYASWEGSLVPLVTHILLLLNIPVGFFLCHEFYFSLSTHRYSVHYCSK